MPPGTLHTVVTTKDCVAIGGHFYSGHQFGLVAWARMIESVHGNFWTNPPNHNGEIFLQRMFIYAVAMIVGFFKSDPDIDNPSHQNLVNSPYPLASLGHLAIMCEFPENFLIQSGVPQQDQFYSSTEFENAMQEWKSFKEEEEDRKRGMTVELARQRIATRYASIQLRDHILSQIEQEQGPAWLCLRERIENANVVNSIRRSIEDERKGLFRVLYSNDDELLLYLSQVPDEEPIICGQGHSCMSDAMAKLIERARVLDIGSSKLATTASSPSQNRKRDHSIVNQYPEKRSKYP